MISLLCCLCSPFFPSPSLGIFFFFFKFPYWLKEHFWPLKSISLFTEAIKTSLQLFHVASALNQEHSWTSNYSFEGNSVSNRARHFPSHSLKFRQPELCKCQVFLKVRLYNVGQIWGGDGVRGPSIHVPTEFYRLDLQRAKEQVIKLGEMTSPTFPSIFPYSFQHLLQC